MVEKQHTSKLSCVASQAAYTRLANRFLKEYKETFETENLPDEILEAYELIKARKEIEYIEESHERTFPWDGGIIRYVKEEWQYYAVLQRDGDYVLYYYFLYIERYKKHYFGVRHSADSYSELIQEIISKKAPSAISVPNGRLRREGFRIIMLHTMLTRTAATTVSCVPVR